MHTPKEARCRVCTISEKKNVPSMEIEAHSIVAIYTECSPLPCMLIQDHKEETEGPSICPALKRIDAGCMLGANQSQGALVVGPPAAWL